MKFIADFHIHSSYSLATSKELQPENLEIFARIKGLKVVATGDFTHPKWTGELKEKLEPAEDGLFKLKKKYSLDAKHPLIPKDEVRFILSSEISSIYKYGDKVRKVHNLILSPDFETVAKIQAAIRKMGGNITSDGRPILGLDSRNLLEIALQANENIFFIPAHIWTPWFSALGSKSGFDSIDECYRDLSKHIHAVETGLSSDAPMNWLCSFLDRFTLLSNSDAHSPDKLGRNANIFDTDLSYTAIVKTLKKEGTGKFLGTIDMFPQEGKYHYDGHRNCGICWNPEQTFANNEICPKCGRKITVGVLNRVMKLADRKNIQEKKDHTPYHSIIPLKEILSEIVGVGPNSKKVGKQYIDLIQKLGSELGILLTLPLDQIENYGMENLATAICKMREKKIHIQEGFDGEFGKIKVFKKLSADSYQPSEKNYMKASSIAES